jgi:hypothetical protein
LKNGGVIRGELRPDSKTADEKTTVAIRTHSGAIIVVDRDAVEVVSRSVPAFQRGSGKNDSIKKDSAKKVSPRRRAAPVLLAVSDGPASAAEKEWFKRVKQYQGWLAGDNPQRQASARDQLKAIREPDAVPALVHFFRNVPDDEQRLVYVGIMSQIDGDRPVVPLAVQAIVDESQPVRELAMRGMLGKDGTKAIPMLLKALKHPQNPIVNRAGNALALVGDDKVVPQLIEALITRHEYKELVLEKNEFTCNDEQYVRGVAVLPPKIAFMVATGQLPAPPESEAVSPFIAPEVHEVTVERQEENPAVLEALVKLTGLTYGYDEPAWRKWYHAGKNVRKKK